MRVNSPRDTSVSDRPTTGPLSFQSPQVVFAGLLASLSPLALLVFNQDWAFTPEAYLDPWHYIGFFREYSNPAYSVGAYKLARLPWILAGYLTNAVFPPVQAALVLHAVFLSVTALALFAGLYALFRRVTLAAVAATALGFYTHAHGSGGWDYHNTGAGAFYLLSFVSLSLPSTIAGRPGALMVAGVVTALAVHTNITFVNFLPVLAFVHLVAVRAQTGQLPPLRSLALRCGWCVLGAVLVTVALGLINVMVGREFLFFAALTRITARYVADPQRVEVWRQGSGWALRAQYLALPAAVFLVGVVVLVVRRAARNDSARLARSLVLQFLVMALVWVGWHMAGQLALDWSYFAYVLIPSCFIAIGGLLALCWPDACERYWLPIVAGTALACWLCLLGAIDPVAQRIHDSVTAAPAVAACLLFTAGFIPFLLRPAIATVVLMLAVFAVGNRFASDFVQGYFASDPCKIQADVYAAVVDGASWLGSLDPTHSRVKTWFDQKEEIHPADGCTVNVGSMADAMTVMSSARPMTQQNTLPAVDDVPPAMLQSVAASQAILVIITDRAERIGEWDRPLDRMGLARQERARRRVAVRESSVSIYAWELGKR